ncbi:MAG: hypothetical protein HFJ87_08600 [Muribaculaceae bacterium]|nr:hypothetical protein [Muribaculaceae bacterium]
MAVRKLLLTAFVAITAAAGFSASAQQVVRKKLAPVTPDMDELVIVGNDTVPIVIPERNFGRYDRGLYNYLFIPKGKWSFGLTASYGELNTDDVQVLSILSDIDFKGKMYSVKPFISYFIRNNQSIGIRFNYSRGIGDLNNLAMDFDEDLSFSIRDVSYYTQSYSTSLFYRNYIGLNKSKRFGIFNEVDVTVGSGSSRFKRIYDGEPKDTRTTITQGSLNFSPGVCVFIQEYVAFNVSFGVFGLNFKREHQLTDGVDEGTRFTSGANFRFNIFNINFGMMVVI